jgi:hypothetical protein
LSFVENEFAMFSMTSEADIATRVQMEHRWDHQ